MSPDPRQVLRALNLPETQSTILEGVHEASRKELKWLLRRTADSIEVALRRRRTQDCASALLPGLPIISHHCLLILGPTRTVAGDAAARTQDHASALLPCVPPHTTVS